MMMHKICVLIIDSEPESFKHTKKLLEADPLVSEINSAADTDQALLKIIDSNPDVIFLEFPAKGNAGKELIRFVKTKLTETTIVYVSTSKEYAAHAIRNEVFNYLLKPIRKAELKKIISKVHLIKHTNIQSRITLMLEQTHEDKKLRFPTKKGYIIINPDEILFCRAYGLYAEMYYIKNKTEISFLSLKKLDEILRPFNFLRVSRFYLINLKYVRKIIRSSNSIFLASDGKEYEIKASKLHIRNLSKIETD